ncbi:hypothetical protein PMARG_ME00237 [Candidatus Mikella endobia]|uniref:Uncharacterized protein n=1 Tax=Candidatus Mikella endobia TaxID=1778264 RepID=A0A143WQE1_9ENTR|nr:hypothetical protein PMARG_ME00237 [Candidatus Mikella endobia]
MTLKRQPNMSILLLSTIKLVTEPIYRIPINLLQVDPTHYYRRVTCMRGCQIIFQFYGTHSMLMLVTTECCVISGISKFTVYFN